MSDTPSHEDILAALKQSGYLMEQVVGTQLEALGYHVTTNRAFEDKDEGKSREMDVNAIKRFFHDGNTKTAAFVEIIAECKNSKNPFVFIGRPKNRADNGRKPHEFIFPIDPYRSTKALDKNRSMTREKHAFFHLGFDQVHYAFKSETKAVQFCRIDRKGKGWEANNGGLYDAMFYPMAKAITARKAELPRNDKPDEWKYFWFLFPLIVLSGEILYVDSTKTDPIPEARDYVTFKRELRSKSLSGFFTLDFVRQDKLESFVSTNIGPLIERATDFAANKMDFVLKRDIPWEDD